MIYRIIESSDYEKWFYEQPPKSRTQIKGRIYNIEFEGHFGDHRLVDSDYQLWELRWENGRRIYFVHLTGPSVLLLLGGNKNGQAKDIRRAKNILQKR